MLKLLKELFKPSVNKEFEEFLKDLDLFDEINSSAGIPQKTLLVRLF